MMRTKMEMEHSTQDTKWFLPAIQREAQNWNLCHYQPPTTVPVDALHNSK